MLAAGHYALANGLPLATPEDVGMSSQRLARIDAVVETAIEEKETAGAVVLVARDGRVVYHGAGPR